MPLQETVVYTAIFDDYDLLLDPRIPGPEIDFVCFTDKECLSSDIWEARKVPEAGLSSAEKNRRVKILAHEYLDDYDYSVYIDGNVQLTGDISDLIERYNKYKFACPEHFKRDCVYEEGEACISQGRGDPDEIREQLERYRRAGLPAHVGLSANSVLFREHNHPEVQELMEAWWNEFQRGSGRDQLSLPYVAWLNDYDYELVQEGPRLESEYFQLHSHLPSGPKRPLKKLWILACANRDSGLRYQVPYYLLTSMRIARNQGVRELANVVGRKLEGTISGKLLELGDRHGLVGPDTIYSSEYYTKRRCDPMRSESRHIGNVFKKEFRPESVIDFGCAVGAYLEPFHEAGCIVQGVEGNRAAIENAVIPQDLIDHHDLRIPYVTDSEYDLVLSIEVAEHLPREAADVFVSTLCSAGSTIVMTAAPPGQGGTHHVNEQPRTYWKEKFKERGFRYDADAVKRLREEIEADVFAHVPANLFVYRQEPAKDRQ